MNGRLENEIKIENSLEAKLTFYPDYVEEWYKSLRGSRKTMSTCRDYINKIGKFLKYINNDILLVEIDDFNSSIVIDYMISLQTKEDENGNITYTSDSFQSCNWYALNSFFSFLYKRHYIDENYMEYVEKTSVHDLDRINEHRVLLTKKDFKKIMDAIENGYGSSKKRSSKAKTKSRDLCIISLFLTTGMRKTAMQNINVSDVNLKDKVLIVYDKGKQIGKKQTYQLSDQMCEILQKWIYIRMCWEDESDALFLNVDGTRMSDKAIYRLVCDVTQYALGYKLSPHKLRAGFVSVLYNKTHDIEYCRRAVGHSNLATTQRYIVTDDKERKEASDYISNILF